MTPEPTGRLLYECERIRRLGPFYFVLAQPGLEARFCLFWGAEMASFEDSARYLVTAVQPVAPLTLALSSAL